MNAPRAINDQETDVVGSKDRRGHLDCRLRRGKPQGAASAWGMQKNGNHRSANMKRKNRFFFHFLLHVRVGGRRKNIDDQNDVLALDSVFEHRLLFLALNPTW
jgi:hypothetical protein